MKSKNIILLCVLIAFKTAVLSIEQFPEQEYTTDEEESDNENMTEADQLIHYADSKIFPILFNKIDKNLPLTIAEFEILCALEEEKKESYLAAGIEEIDFKIVSAIENNCQEYLVDIKAIVIEKLKNNSLKVLNQETDNSESVIETISPLDFTRQKNQDHLYELFLNW